MTERSRQERLAHVAEEAHEDWCMENEARDPWHRDSWAAVAAKVFDSDVIREIKAEAWDKSHAAWDRWYSTREEDAEPPNPYREADHG